VRVSYLQYVEWLEGIASALGRAKPGASSVFGRYATHTNPPEDPSPTNILLDLDEELAEFTALDSVGTSPRSLDLEDTCYDVQDGEFHAVANSGRFPVSIRYDTEKKSYQLRSPSLEQAFARLIRATEDKQENIVSFFNRKQSFRIITRTQGVIYAHGRFYQPRLPLWGKDYEEGFDLLRVFYPDARLKDIDSEKGRKCARNGSGWGKGSLFRFIDRIGHADGLASSEVFDHLVCDDMGTEVADFIAVSSSDRRVAFIHAKHHGAAKVSARAFQEVCAQATKNLVWIHPFSEKTIPNIGKWDATWTAAGIGTVARRIRRGPQDSASQSAALSEILRDPGASREVWIVLAQGFSYGEFQKQRKRVDPRPEIVQLFFLLQSVWAAVSSVGATLRIYCPT
jgi:hypothetical protein